MPFWPDLLCKARSALRDETGSGAVLPLFMLTVILAVGGVATDLASLWRQSEIMRATADTAAHSGVVALARGLSTDDAVAVAETAIGMNMNPEVFEAAANKPRSQLVRVWHYNAATGSLSEDGPANAVSVQIRRSELDGNQLPTYLLGLLGLGEITASTTAVVALVPTASCQNASGVFAREAVQIEGQTEVGSGYCLHSQTSIDLAQSAKFEDGAKLSMPDLANCSGFCRKEYSPGLESAAYEANLISGPLLPQISQVMTEMLKPMDASDRKRDFFATRPISEDLEPIAEVGRSIASLRTGSVVRLPKAEFEKMREYPQGLVYVVTCDETLSSGPQMLEVGGIVGAPRLANSVLLTSCALHFRAGFEITGSLVLTTFDGTDSTITADAEAVLGDPAGDCQAAAQTVVMAIGDQILPATLTRSNVALMIDGNVTLLPDDHRGIARHVGFALHASGTVNFQGNHGFVSCGASSNAILPGLDVIRYVMPKVPSLPLNKMIHPKMPGKTAPRLPSTPSLPMSKPPADLISQAELPGSEFGL